MEPPLTAIGAGKAGPFTSLAGVLSYTEICLNLMDEEWTEVDDISGPYAYGNDTWVGYDNVNSTQAKAMYILDKGLGGAMMWDLSFDDFNVSVPITP